ncbi:helix-turn-helix transcriptional regulator [Paractinoplanes hotanensis]|uniref:LuxR C-terminal-related transcriptional regulator n=1 Tax=Paractinoplanes hotanensis TaxID=2906497 RepID=A0ABT0YG96_9ACTN|nr:LuxR family transcriptional regulator [Actinoplanes hotanensis]MCM4085105.1 LuxR C-terminal-related transcriptional regulator [Actinoplanes hotanensis]
MTLGRTTGLSVSAHLSLVGRGAEQAAIGTLLDGAVKGGAALVFVGAPGVGKSALLEWAAARAGDKFRVLRTVGSVTEFGLPYAALHQVMRTILRHTNGLTVHHRLALDVAFGGTSGASPDLYTVAMAALELLAEAAVERPVLLLADDAQWMDPASQQVLGFVARRVASDRVVLLATNRENEPGFLLDATIPSMGIAPLDTESAARLLDVVAGGLDPSTRSLLLDAACGNPLALLELPRAIHVSASANPNQLALTARLEDSFLTRVGELDAVTRTLLEVAALNDSDDVTEIAAAVDLLSSGDIARSLDPAVSAGLIAVDGAVIRFRHPLIRSAILQRLGPDRRRAGHAALARVLVGQPERSVWHRASAALRPDAALAAELERHAERSIERGAPANAVRALERAAQLSNSGRGRRERAYRAAVLAYAVGRLQDGERLRRSYRDLVDGEHDGLRYEWLNELAGADHGGDQRINVLLDLAAGAKAAGDDELATNFLRASALRCWNLLPGRPVGRQVIAAADRLAVADKSTRAELLAYCSPLDSAELVRALIAEVPAADRDSATTYRLAHAAACAGAVDVSEGLLIEAAERLRSEGQLYTLGRALSLLAWSALRRGHWSHSVAAADESTRLCAETGQSFWEASSLVAHAAVAAFRGDFESAQNLIARADRLDSRRLATIEAATLVARGAIASGQGNYEQAFACLAQLHDPAGGAYHPAHALWSLASLAEAATACGEVTAARALVAGLPPEVRETTSPTGRMNLGIARAVLAAEDESDAMFAKALGINMAMWPYEHYRLLFTYGRLLRRQRRVRESRDYLRKARDGFDSLGARPLAERAREELRAAGERSDSHTEDIWDVLSPQEIQIASMVAQGLSNRDIAKGLFISHRTVGSHLYRMFPKLGITSRGELQRMAAEHNL